MEDTPFSVSFFNLVIFVLGLLLYCKVTEVRVIFHFNCMYVSCAPASIRRQQKINVNFSS